MYTNKEFVEFYPEILNAKEKAIVDNYVALRTEFFAEISKRVQEESKDPASRYSFRKRIKETPTETEVKWRAASKQVKAIVEKAKVTFFTDNAHLTFASTEEAMAATIKAANTVYGWYKDVSDYKATLNGEYDKYATNYWYYMEWQSDLLSIAAPIFALNNRQIPKDLPFTPEHIYEVFSLACGYSYTTSKERLLENIFHNFNTAVAWAYDSSEDWILNSYPNTTKKTFADHLVFWISLYNFVNSQEMTDDMFNREGPGKEDSYFYVKPLLEKFGDYTPVKTKEEIAKVATSAVKDLVDWIQEGKNLNISDNKVWWQKNKAEELSELGLCLVALQQESPEEEFFHSVEFKEAIRLVNQYALPKAIYTFDTYYLLNGFYNTLFEILRNENDDYNVLSNYGINTVQKFRAIYHFMEDENYFGYGVTAFQIDVEKAMEVVPFKVFTEEEEEVQTKDLMEFLAERKKAKEHLQ